MKKSFLLLFSLFLFYSCLNKDDNLPFSYRILPIAEAITPTSFTFGETYSITVKYSFPNTCYEFDDIYNQYDGITRTIAVSALYYINDNCTTEVISKEYTFPVVVDQQEDYLFKFWKGKNSDGSDIYDEVLIPVN